MAESTRRDFVANASHELRTPVSAIAGAAETLLSGAMDDPAQARLFVEMIARNAERLARLTNDLLDLSRIESRQWPVKLEPVSVEGTARRAMEVCSEPARRKRIELRVEVPEGTAVLADARALEQVLVNLLDNAVKYTPDGGSATVTAAPGLRGPDRGGGRRHRARASSATTCRASSSASTGSIRVAPAARAEPGSASPS